MGTVVGSGRGVRLLLAAVLGVLVLLFTASRALAAPAVTIQAPVNDHAGVLTPEERDNLTQKLLAHRQRTGVQMAVLLVRTTGGVPIEDYSLEIAEAWGGGTEKHDNGVLYTLAIDDRRMRIEVGYGLEDILTDGVCRTILDASRDDLRRAQYGSAARFVVGRLVALTADQKMGPGGARAVLGSPSEHVLRRYIAHYTLGALFGLLLGFVARRAPRAPTELGDLEGHMAAQRGTRRVVVTAVLAFVVVPAIAALAPAWAYRARSEAAASTYLEQQADSFFGAMLLAALFGLLGGLSLFRKRAWEEPWQWFLRGLGIAIVIAIPLTGGMIALDVMNASLPQAFITSFLAGLFALMNFLIAKSAAASSGSSWDSSAAASSTTSSYSYSPPSYSSPSYASSDHASSSSSSSSSSDYGGGGGSFGGGGASSSW
ncbi:TPM domain-containing protein [Sorangium sp. So ce513]|uniref:TPM domain-containing protein n=1 Tax=Sorangium sp. So ce513 TaxID=3133315 RepID=UPI003F6243C6